MHDSRKEAKRRVREIAKMLKFLTTIENEDIKHAAVEDLHTAISEVEALYKEYLNARR